MCVCVHNTRDEPGVVEGPPREPVVKGKEELRQGKHDVLVERVRNEQRQSHERIVAVHKQQSAQVVEPVDREIRG